MPAWFGFGFALPLVPAKVPGSGAASTAGQPIGLLLLLTKAS